MYLIRQSLCIKHGDSAHGIHLVHILVLVDGLVWQAEVELHCGRGLGCGKTPEDRDDRPQSKKHH